MMPKLWRWCAIGLALLLAVAVAYGFVQDRRADRLDSAVAYQRSQRLEVEAQAMGWQTQWATVVPDLLAAGAEKDTMLARLRESVRLAGAHTVARTVVAAEARADTVLVADTVYADHSRRWQIDIPPYSGSATYYPPERLHLELHARIRAELIGSIAPDGRLLVTARSPDPGVTLDVQTLEWDPPEVEGPSIWGKLMWAAGGATVCALFC